MGRKNRPRRADAPGQADAFRVNPFAGLPASLAAPKPPPPPPKPPPPPEARHSVDPELARAFGAGAEAGGGPRVRPGVLRFDIERKGHGGKTVTLVRGLGRLAMIEEMELLQAIRQALGVGGSFAEGVLHLQGDQRERARAWFERRRRG
ncbi:MAG: translation initiation factor [Lentisphaeria bacterium]|nr:translation initiation factor [Lentisphaeria bacterium]